MSSSVVELLAKDLTGQGGVFCPNPKADMKLWNSHPKVYLEMAHDGAAKLAGGAGDEQGGGGHGNSLAW